MNETFFYVDHRFGVTEISFGAVAGPFSDELSARQWIDNHLDQQADKILQVVIRIEEMRENNRRLMTLCTSGVAA